MKKREISVIVCAFNPRIDLLQRSIEALERQSIGAAAFELIVVDNNSSPPLRDDDLRKVFSGDLELVRELRQGLSIARAAGVARACADLICFVDDDNILDPDYLEAAVQIAGAEPRLGAFGGRAHGRLERPVSGAFAAFLPYFGVNDQGDAPLTGCGGRLGPWTPIGAGLCVRREIAKKFERMIVARGGIEDLGRRGAALMSGEDTVFSIIADRAGFNVGYRPQLNLDHVITEDRLNYRYLARLMEGHGRSRILLRELLDVGPVDDPPADTRRSLAMNALRRLKGHGPLRAYGMFFWDLGRYRQQCGRDARARLAAADRKR